MLQIPLPGVPPLALAAEAISPGKMDAEQLAKKVQELIDRLACHGITIISYSCDGIEVEQKIQGILTKSATSIKTWMFTHPAANHEPLVISAPVYNGSPVVMMQDTKHLKKTLRNNVFSGAWALVLGNYVVGYHQIQEIGLGGMAPNGLPPPLFQPNVEKEHRQDD